MKLCWTLLLLLSAGCSSHPETWLVKDAHGHVRAEVARVNGRKQGPVRYFNGNGTLRTIGSYTRDSRDGAWTTFGPKGDTLSIVQFRKGRKNGLQGYWGPNRQLLRLEQFTNGAPNGFLYRFFPDGSPRQVTWYDHGVAEGPYLEWYKVDSTSVALTMGQFRNGKRTGTWTWFYGNGKVQRQGAYNAGVATGLWRYWDAMGHELAPEKLGHH